MHFIQIPTLHLMWPPQQPGNDKVTYCLMQRHCDTAHHNLLNDHRFLESPLNMALFTTMSLYFSSCMHLRLVKTRTLLHARVTFACRGGMSLGCSIKHLKPSLQLDFLIMSIMIMSMNKEHCLPGISTEQKKN